MPQIVRRFCAHAASGSRNLHSLIALLLILTSPATPQAKKQPHETQHRPAVSPGVIIRDATFQSASLGREMTYRIILPADYETAQKRYPVLYLLHGLYGHYVDWESRTHLDDYVAGMPLIIAMPEGDDSWYTNSVSEPQEKWEDYIVKDFIPHIDKTYRTIQTRHARAIAGLSMGGYGAMKLAFKYPWLFVFAGSMSGALDVTRNDQTHWLGAKQQARIESIYGPAGTPARADNDPYSLAEKLDKPDGLPFLWIACGTADPWIGANHQVIDLLVKKKVPHFYEESAGEHNWQFWDEHLPPMLSLLMSRYFGMRNSELGIGSVPPMRQPPRKANPSSEH